MAVNEIQFLCCEVFLLQIDPFPQPTQSDRRNKIRKIPPLRQLKIIFLYQTRTQTGYRLPVQPIGTVAPETPHQQRKIVARRLFPANSQSITAETAPSRIRILPG